MRDVRLAFVLLALSASTLASDSAKIGSGRYCAQTQFGACRVVHGRYGIYVENNGIWDIRVKRLLGTSGDAELDRIIYNMGRSFDHEILGDFTVCPLSKLEDPADKPMRTWQEVCVQSFKNTKVVKRRD